MVLGIANLHVEGHGVLRRGEAGDTVLAEGLEVVDGVPGQLAQPLIPGPVVVVLDVQPLGQFGDDRAVVATGSPAPCRSHSGGRRPAGVGPEDERLLPKVCADARTIYIVPAHDRSGEGPGHGRARRRCYNWLGRRVPVYAPVWRFDR